MSSDALALIVGDALLMGGTVTASLISTRRTRVKLSEKLDEHTERVDGRLDTIQKQTDNRQDAKIRYAVEAVTREHPGLVSTAVATEAVTLLLDAILESNLDDGDDGPRRRRRPHDR